ncbi:hypothetical protein BJV45_003102 [Clostridium saccharoperbutylacetonicum]|uniref:Uncharacterized protein n=2 Tax=Clostridium saccharoperbutylacetonicum TaxID=36745 RepID=M1MRT9_9CLOT|nr:hypothetical protein [Clostridium saccharoperbutylacetonicum]AGF57466.1 hypothetical protein Cspa_c37060 [Clostridium saccharoperbutylacetonicum N1-4(HMT)]NRT61768.1 hypothetical protein [Clostridium saccharoperbutylacetonicum]NSB25092.1 hypothetical protein [Clostridium saccharoperbutylacetonicum]
MPLQVINLRKNVNLRKCVIFELDIYTLKSDVFSISLACLTSAIFASGALYVSTVTPDGYKVDENGAWLH